jgi:hypothetical protein
MGLIPLTYVIQLFRNITKVYGAITFHRDIKLSKEIKEDLF